MRPYETEVLWLKKLVSGYFVSEQHIKCESLVGVRMVTKIQTGAAPRTPRESIDVELE